MKSQKMSKAINTVALSRLRELSEDEIHNLLKFDEFSFNGYEVESINNPDMDMSNAESFYYQFAIDESNEFELAKIIYESLPMTREQASNNKYWTYLNLKYFFRYIKERWLLKSKSIDEVTTKDFSDAFLITQSSQNTLIKAPVAGLWWAVHLTIDPSNTEDKYYYTRIFLSDRNLRDKNLGTYRLIRDNNTLKALLDFYVQNKNEDFEGKSIGSEAMAQQMTKMLNQIGGLTLLSFLSKEEILAKLNLYHSTVKKRAYNVKLGKVVSREKKVREKNREMEEQENDSLETIEASIKSSGVPPFKVFNLNKEGEYKITDNIDSSFDYHAEIHHIDKKGHLLMCYQEGYINRVTVSSLLLKIGPLYQNGLYRKNKTSDFYKPKELFVINESALIGISYIMDGVQYFKVHESNQFKEDNKNVGLQGLKVTYGNFKRGSVRYYILPNYLRKDLNRLVMSSFTASGAKIRSRSYREEHKILSKYLDID